MSTKILWKKGCDRNGNYTEDCAADTNRWLQERGVESYGNAYEVPSQFKSVVNGYKTVDLPDMTGYSPSDSTKTIMNVHRQASDYIKDNFDVSQLNPKENYVVNMYYNTSPHMNDFYQKAQEGDTGNYGTHVGRLYNDAEKGWVVEHNIHGNIHIDPYEEVVGGKSNANKYGITSISTTKPTLWTHLRNIKNKFIRR